MVVPMPLHEFNNVLVGKKQWYPVVLAEKKIGQLRHLAAYVTKPTSAITHVARIRAIKPRPDGRYTIHLEGEVKRIKPVSLGGVKGGVRRLWYTTQRKLGSAKSLRDL